MANIIVCMKQVLDPEAPTSTYQVDGEARRVLQRGVPPVWNPYDDNALEAALRIKNSQRARITVVSMGHGLSSALARKPLAAGADRIVFLEDSTFDGLDSYATASVLASAIVKIRTYDIVLTGRLAADTNAGAVGPGIAEMLGIPSVTVARKVELNGDRARVERVLPDGYDAIEVSPPVLITVSHELGELRSVTAQALMAAAKKPITTWSADDLGVRPSQMTRSRLVKVYIPQRKSACEFVTGGTEEELGQNLALKLRAVGLI